MAYQDDLRCPKCLGVFDTDDRQLRCRSCHATFPLEGGIADLRGERRDYYFNPVPPAEMERLVREMTPPNWPETIRAFVRHTRNDTEWIDNLVVDGRYAWKLLLDLNPDTVLLDLGCGLGNLTQNLAPFARKAYALDLTYLRLAFSKRRFSFFNAGDDISLIAGGDTPHLPFRDAALDCVIVSGVLEWVGKGESAPFEEGNKIARLARMLAYQFGNRSPRQLQLRFLKEIRRVLKPGGQLFIAIENRLGHPYFEGRPDHHSALMYGSLLPRFLANLYSIARHRTPYRTYTYSIPGYTRLLRDAGFPEAEFIGLSRGYDYLEEIIPARIDVPAWTPEAVRGVKAALRRSKYFVPAYGIIAGSAAKPWRRLQDGLLDSVARDLHRSIGPGNLTINRFLVSEREKITLKCSFAGRAVRVRIPVNDTALRSESINSKLLEQIRQIRTISEFAPAALGRGTVGRLAYFVEEYLPGRPLKSETGTKARPEWVPSLSKLLDTVCTAPVPAPLQPLVGDLYEREVTRRLLSVFRVVSDSALRDRVSGYFHRSLHGAETAVGLFHGEFGMRNILAHDGRITGLVDWGNGSEQGLPILDAISYLAGAQAADRPSDKLDHVVGLLASRRWPIAEEWRFLLERYTALRMDHSRHEAWTYLFWLHAVNLLLASNLLYDAARIDSHVIEPLRTFAR